MQTYIHPETNAQVELERWSWNAIYEDGNSLQQFSHDGIFHNFKEIDQIKLQTFQMRNNETGKLVTILFPAGAKLIHFYRNIGLEVGGPNERTIKLYCFGYELGSIHCYFVITPSDEVIFTNEFDRVEAS